MCSSFLLHRIFFSFQLIVLNCAMGFSCWVSVDLFIFCWYCSDLAGSSRVKAKKDMWLVWVGGMKRPICQKRVLRIIWQAINGVYRVVPSFPKMRNGNFAENQPTQMLSCQSSNAKGNQVCPTRLSNLDIIKLIS